MEHETSRFDPKRPELSTSPSLEGCKNCTGMYCCAISMERKMISPPYLTKYDIDRIKTFTGLDCHIFAKRRRNPHTGNYIFFLKNIQKRCLFFDPQEGRCQVYAIRPVDCCLFPLDVRKMRGGYYWIIYTPDCCKLTTQDYIHLLAYRDQAFYILRDEIHDYATIDTPKLSEMRYKVIDKVAFLQEEVHGDL